MLPIAKLRRLRASIPRSRRNFLTIFAASSVVYGARMRSSLDWRNSTRSHAGQDVAARTDGGILLKVIWTTWLTCAPSAVGCGTGAL